MASVSNVHLFLQILEILEYLTTLMDLKQEVIQARKEISKNFHRLSEITIALISPS